MYDNIACEPPKEVTLEQIIKDSHEALCEIEVEVDAIGSILFGVDLNEQKRDDRQGVMYIALVDDVVTEKRIAQKLSHIIGRLR